MDRKYRTPSASLSIAIIGDNFVSDYVYRSFRRYSKLKPISYNNVSDINSNIDYIIDITFNDNQQDKSIKYSIDNDLSKIIIVNHWKRQIESYDKLAIIQAIVPDVYGYDHMSFSRPGNGNSYDPEVNYCTLICEGIRRIHESKSNFIPITYISYGQDKLKYIYVDNLYKPLEHLILNINKTSEHDIYDDEKNSSYVLNVIKDIIEYQGTIVFDNTRSVYNKPVKKIDIELDHRSLHYYIRKIYNYLINNNERFIMN